MRTFPVLLALAWCIVARLAAADSPLILISLDGFRWDYTALYAAESPTLQRLKREGASTRALIPVFPSNTFPNHYTLVTGLYPAKHGIINNDFFDPALGAVFRFNQPNAVRDARFWQGEPIWVTAIKQGRKAATAFWVGSDAEIGGVRPTFWQHYDYSIPFEKRLEELVHWLTLPSDERPAVVAFYLEEANGAGHRYGPNSPQVAAAVKLCDERIARMLAQLAAEQVEPNVVIVSDHGMSATSRDRVVVLEEHIDRTTVQVDCEGTVMALRPLRDNANEIFAALTAIPHLKVYRAADLPREFHFTDNDRIAPIWVLADEGWEIGTRATLARLENNYRAQGGFIRGDHGYDPRLPNMGGILIAHGPAFRRGVEVDAVENIHVYNLLCAALRLTPAKNDGDDRLVTSMLR